MNDVMRGMVAGFLCSAGLILAACHHGGSGGASPITVGGTVSGLVNAAGLKLEDNGTPLTVSANGSFAFSAALTSGTKYDITVAEQPAGENCTVTNGTGTVGSTSVANIVIACTPEHFKISGALAGLLSGRSLIVQDDGGNSTTLSANGAFSFSTQVASGSNYAVTVLTQPVGQSCAVTKGSGTVAAADVTNVSISCSDDTYNVAVTVSGVNAGGLQLEINGTDALSVSTNGKFNFNTPIASGSTYVVTIVSQPLGESCSVTNGSGTIVSSNVSNVTVSCTPKLYPISGTVSGLLSGRSLILQDDGSNNTTVAGNGQFSFSTQVASGSSYSVTVLSQPAGQSCAVSHGSGIVQGSAVSNVSIACSDHTYNIGVTVSGVVRSGLVLEDNGADNLAVSANGSFNFALPLPSGSPYAVTLLTQPAGESCTVTNGTGTVVAANVTGIPVVCTPLDYSIGGSLTGLLTNNSLVLEDNGGNATTLSANGNFTFSSTIASGSAYAVTVSTQPSGQNCTVSNGSGTVVSSNVGMVGVACSDNTYNIGVSVSGLVSGESIVLQDNGGDNLTVSANGSANFATPIASGSPYAVTILTQPPGGNCTLSNNASGTVSSSNVSVTVSCTPNHYTVGGTVSGLESGNGVTLADNGADDTTVSANSSFSFPTSVASGSPYAVTIVTQPLGETCTVANGSGTIGSSNVSNVTVSCTPNLYTISGTLAGLLSGRSLILQDNGANSTTLSANGQFSFSTQVASGSSYSVTILSQPSGQSCAVTHGSGTVQGSAVSNVSVSCSDDTYNIGVAVSGVIRSGLVLQDNGADNLTASSNGSFNFATPVPSGSPYAVTLLTQPAGESCTVTNGSGTVVASNVTGIPVQCTPLDYSIGGSLSGLLSNNSVILEDNGGNATTLSANGTFTFSSTIASGSAYAVTVSTQPPGQNCTVSNGSGTVVSSNVTTVGVACSDNTYNIGVTVSGLVSGTSVVLQDNGGDNLTVSANGSANFATPVASGSGYSVTILTQPLGEVCSLSGNASGTVRSSNVTVTLTCTPNNYTVGGTVAGLLSGNSVILKLNGADATTVSTNSGFSFSTQVASGSAYAVTISTQPPGQTCSVSNGSGTVAGANVTNVAVSCSDNTYNIGVTVSGLTGSGLVLQDNGGDNLTIGANGSVNFATPIPSGSTYSVTVLTQPTDQTCTVTSGSGTVTSANVSGIPVSCVTNTQTIGGTLSGLTSGSLVLQDNGGDNLTLSANGSFTFATPVAEGNGYAVTVSSQPPGQTCSVSNGSGTVAVANVTNVAVSCTVNTYTIGVTVSGLTGSGLVLQDNGGDNLAISANGSANFATPIPTGSTYAVTVLTQPSGQTCTVTSGSGTVTNANVTGIPVSCVASYTIGGSLVGLASSGTIVLQDNGGDNLTLTANGSFTFATPVVNGGAYAVTILTQPQGQTCAVGSGSGTVSAANVTAVIVRCGNLWTWVGGSNGVNANGVYGTKGSASTGNAPGAREFFVSWTDTSGNMWLFGGTGYPSSGADDYLNDLWKFSPTAGTWEWVSGSNSTDASGVYGSLGTAAPGNVPGARNEAVSWTDAAGNLWLFGGYGYDGSGSLGPLNDLWKFSPTAGTWEWVSGSNTVNAGGVYGSRGVASANNVPGARFRSISWTDPSGNLWLLGGDINNQAIGNDLWKFSPTAGTWEWVSGSNTTDASGVYGPQGSASTGYVPGARELGVSWTDASGNLWLFGGYAFDTNGTFSQMNDLWKFNPSNGTWEWASGSDTINALGVYGTQGVAQSGNVPGARIEAISWIDGSGNLWLFGGNGYGSSGSSVGMLNDLWKFNPTAGTWEWVSGSDVFSATGVYGTEGLASPGNVPGARECSASWVDSSGHLWLFGGYGYGASNAGFLNDLWEYAP